MALAAFRCAHCGKRAEKEAGHVNRSREMGLRLFCGRRCAGLSRQKHKTKAQKIAEKREYDAEYRQKNLALIKAKKREYFKRTYNPEKARIERKKRMPKHVEYCRRPKYKVYKQKYDREYRANKFGAFADAYLLTVDLNRAIKERSTNEQIKWENRTANKAQFRRREAKQKERSRPRNRDRRDRHTAALS